MSTKGRKISIEDAAHIRSVIGTRNPNGRRVTQAQLAEDYNVTVVTIASIIGCQGTYADDLAHEEKTLGGFLTWLSTSPLEDVNRLHLKKQVNDLSLRDARQLSSLIADISDALGFE